MVAIQSLPERRALRLDKIVASPNISIALVAKENQIGEAKSTEYADTTLPVDRQASDQVPSGRKPLSLQGTPKRIVRLSILAIVLIGVNIMLLWLPSPPKGERARVLSTTAEPRAADLASVEAPPHIFEATTKGPDKEVARWDDSFIEQLTVRVVSALRRESTAAQE